VHNFSPLASKLGVKTDRADRRREGRTGAIQKFTVLAKICHARAQEFFTLTRVRYAFSMHKKSMPT